MAFSLTISLDVAARPAVVIGGGPEAVARVEALLYGEAAVTIVTPHPDPRLVALADDGAVTLHRRGYADGDLAGTFIAYVTREDPTPVERTWDEASRERVLLSTLDDVARCHFATPSVLRRGDLAVTIATMGRAPALARRLRHHLEDLLGPEVGDLVTVLDAARTASLPRTVPFDQWAARWTVALADLDGLLARVRAGDHDRVRDEVVRALSTPVHALSTPVHTPGGPEEVPA